MQERKIIINFCPTGMVPDKKMTPHVPLSVNEIIEDTQRAYELGITIVHLHARDRDGSPAWEKEIYRDIFEGVRKHCPDLVICGSTSGRVYSEFEKRSEVIELRPDMCSLTLSSMNFARQPSVNNPGIIKKLVKKMGENGVHPELECFDLGMINYGRYLIKKNWIKGPYYWNLLFGNIAGFQATFSHMGTAVNELAQDHYFALAGIGRSQLPVCAAAIAMGYGVRIGLEDNIWWDRERTRLTSNQELLHRVHEFIKLHNREYMGAKEFGELGFYNRIRQAEKNRAL